MESRRGFLKTLGKLAAVVGITSTAVAVSNKGDTSGTALKGPRNGPEVKGGKPIIADFNYKPRSLGATKTTLEETAFRVPLATPIPPELPNEKAQRVCNEMYNSMVDNMRMREYPPQTVVSMDQYDAIMKMEQIRNLDPYKWGEVFDLKWIPFKARPNMEMYEGGWEARVRPAFNKCFASAGSNEIFRTQVLISQHEMYLTSVPVKDQNQHERNRRLVSHYKEASYRKIVDELQRVIRQEAGPERFFENYNDEPSRRDLRKLKGITS